MKKLKNYTTAIWNLEFIANETDVNCEEKDITILGIRPILI